MIEEIVAFHQTSFFVEIARDQEAGYSRLQLVGPFPFGIIVFLFIIKFALGTAIFHFATHREGDGPEMTIQMLA